MGVIHGGENMIRYNTYCSGAFVQLHVGTSIKDINSGVLAKALVVIDSNGRVVRSSIPPPTGETYGQYCERRAAEKQAAQRDYNVQPAPTDLDVARVAAAFVHKFSYPEAVRQARALLIEAAHQRQEPK